MSFLHPLRLALLLGVVGLAVTYVVVWRRRTKAMERYAQPHLHDRLAPDRRRGARHDVVVAHVTDPREDQLPAVGMLALVDPETGRRREVQTSSRRFRERYAAAAAERRSGIEGRLRQARVEAFTVSTDRDWLRDVIDHVVARRRRR